MGRHGILGRMVPPLGPSADPIQTGPASSGTGDVVTSVGQVSSGSGSLRAEPIPKTTPDLNSSGNVPHYLVTSS